MKRIITACLLIAIPVLFIQSIPGAKKQKGLNPHTFAQVAHFGHPRDIELLYGDANHNDKREILLVYRTIDWQSLFMESQGNNIYSAVDSFYCDQESQQCLGEIDTDNLTDFSSPYTAFGTILSILRLFESVSSDSFPNRLMMTDSLVDADQGRGHYSSYFCDLDQDGKRDIITGGERLGIFECTGNDSFENVFNDDFSYMAVDIAINDFDKDGRTEFCFGNSGSGSKPAFIFIYECQGGDNAYLKIDSMPVALDYHSIYQFAPPEPNRNVDMDQDGKLEFACSGINIYGLYGPYTTFFSLFERTGDNSFTEVWTDSFDLRYPSAVGYPGCPNYVAYDIGIGDVDGDGIDEMICMDGYQVSVFKSTGDNQYQEIHRLDLPSIAGLEHYDDVRTILCDVNQNGYAEIVLSLGNSDVVGGNYQTYIYEICGQANFGGLTAVSRDSCVRVEWSTLSQYANRGFRLWRAVGGDYGYSVVYETNDTVKLSLDTLRYSFNDSSVTAGLLYYYKVQAKALNTDSIFYGPVSVVYVGVSGQPEDRAPSFVNRLCPNAPNPFTRGTVIRYQVKDKAMVSLKVYNNNGQLVRALIDRKFREPGEYAVRWNGRNDFGHEVSAGVYYCQLNIGGWVRSGKMVKLR